MSCKRKRSFSSTPSSLSESSPSRSPHPSSWPQEDNDIAMTNTTSYPIHQIDNWTMTITPLPYSDPSYETSDQHLHSRTRKRFRDNRPSDTTIHGTLSSPDSPPRYLLRSRKPRPANPAPPKKPPTKSSSQPSAPQPRNPSPPFLAPQAPTKEPHRRNPPSTISGPFLTAPRMPRTSKQTARSSAAPKIGARTVTRRSGRGSKATRR
ncbi:hypothetical protein MMC12_006759 [Toensbergia leucococca]|nr:hypothetical protein [Toensbergia leucococca]